MLQNSKTQAVTKIKSSKYDTTQKLDLRQNLNCDYFKTQIVNKLKNSDCYNSKTQIVTKAKLWENSTTQIVTKLKKHKFRQTLTTNEMYSGQRFAISQCFIMLLIKQFCVHTNITNCFSLLLKLNLMMSSFTAYLLFFYFDLNLFISNICFP